MAGFHPNSSLYASRKLKYVVENKVNPLISESRIPIEQSISAFIVPDSLGILAPDEVFVSFSGAGPIDPDTRCPTSHLLGEVLIFRSPCKLPTDIRKFTAVYKPELCHLKDCIIMSASATLCDRSPASFLSGGDYDGDTATVIYDARIVGSFQNADEKLAIASKSFEEENFEKELIKSADFLDALKGADDQTLIINKQTFLLGAMLDEEYTGWCRSTQSRSHSSLLTELDSTYHDNSVYMLGYDHPETVRLARM